MKLTRILCPTDFSDPALHAVRVAGRVARQFDAELLLVHVVTPLPPVTAPPAPATYDVAAFERQLEETARQTLNQLIEQELQGCGRVRPLVVQGPAAEQVTKVAEKQAVDLIVIATHGRTGWRRFIFGSVAEKVVRLAPCPVLTVPPPHEQRQED
ncbi:MAG: universal stress protein [Candidatus Bipolaricaulaceae bacterium]